VAAASGAIGGKQRSRGFRTEILALGLTLLGVDGRLASSQKQEGRSEKGHATFRHGPGRYFRQTATSQAAPEAPQHFTNPVFNPYSRESEAIANNLDALPKA
jgi:hypothetical protein